MLRATLSTLALTMMLVACAAYAVEDLQRIAKPGFHRGEMKTGMSASLNISEFYYLNNNAHSYSRAVFFVKVKQVELLWPAPVSGDDGHNVTVPFFRPKSQKSALTYNPFDGECPRADWALFQNSSNGIIAATRKRQGANIIIEFYKYVEDFKGVPGYPNRRFEWIDDMTLKALGCGLDFSGEIKVLDSTISASDF